MFLFLPLDKTKCPHTTNTHISIYCKYTQIDNFYYNWNSVSVDFFCSSCYTYWLSTNLEWFLFFSSNIVLLRCVCLSVCVFACVRFFSIFFKVQVVNLEDVGRLLYATFFSHSVFPLRRRRRCFQWYWQLLMRTHTFVMWHNTIYYMTKTFTHTIPCPLCTTFQPLSPFLATTFYGMCFG